MAEPQVDLVRGLAEATGFGILGRLSYHALTGRRPTSLVLWLWELPAACGLGVMGQALGVWLELSDWPRAGLIAFVAAAGIKAIDAAIDRAFPGDRKQ